MFPLHDAPLTMCPLHHFLKTLNLYSGEGVLTQLSKVGQVTNPARGQLNRENVLFSCARLRQRLEGFGSFQVFLEQRVSVFHYYFHNFCERITGYV